MFTKECNHPLCPRKAKATLILKDKDKPAIYGLTYYCFHHIFKARKTYINYFDGAEIALGLIIEKVE